MAGKQANRANSTSKQTYAILFEEEAGSGSLFGMDFEFLILTKKPKRDDYHYLRMIFLPPEEGGFSEKPVPAYPPKEEECPEGTEILWDTITTWTAGSAFVRTHTIKIIAPYKFWVILHRYGWRQNDPETDEYLLLEARGPFRNRDAALEQITLPNQ